MKNRQPLVSIIIVNYNGLGLLKDCFNSLIKIDYPRWEVIVVDNGSKDGSVEFLEKYKGLPSLKLISNDHNLGFAEPNNQGLKKADGDYVLLLNNDTRVKSDLLTKMIARMEKDEKIGVAQPKIYLMERDGYLDNTGSYLTATGFLEHEGCLEKDSPKFSQEKKVFATKGACMLIKREVINKVGLFDKDFFAYFEESDFCWRVWLAGYEVIYFPETYIFHKLGATSKNMNQLNINYHSLKNRICSLLKNLQTRNLFTVFTLHIAICIFLCLLYLFKAQWGKLKMVTTAIFWNLIHLRATFSKRKYVQHVRVRSDMEIFNLVGKRVNVFKMLNHFRKVEENFK